MDIWQMIGGLGVVFTASQLLPQVIKSLKTKEVTQLSLGMIVIVALSAIAWLAYAIHYHMMELIIANALNLLAALILLALKVS